jgi:TRAP-type uncharacterized transport system substrate-binding protein
LRAFLAACTVVLAIIAIGIGASYVVLHPTVLKVAVPASDPIDQRVFGAAAEMQNTQRAPVRLELVAVDGAPKALEALESRKVDLAVVRSDAAMRDGVHTVVIMRREVAVLIAPKTGKVQKIADLAGAMVGVTREGPLDGGLLRPVLDYYGIAREKTKYMALPPDEIANALKTKKVDAIIAVGATASKQMGDFVAEAARGVKGAIQFIDIEEADAIAKRIPALESVEVDQGAFGGRPPRPPESFNTLGYSIRLVATQKADNDTITELLRQLYLIRQNLSATIPGAGLMEAPDVDEATSFLIHPGVRVYVNVEHRSFLDRYSDWVYLGMFVGSGLGSVTAGLFGMMTGRRGRDPTLPVRNLQSVLDAVRNAQSAAELDQLEQRAEEIFRETFAHGLKDELSAAGVASVDMAMRELRSRLAARRNALAVAPQPVNTPAG